MRRMRALSTGMAVAGVLCAGAQADIVLSDFNVDNGLFQYSVTFSGTTNVLATSTVVRTTDPGEQLEGAGAQKLSIDVGTPAAGFGRVRHLAGVTTAGAPAGQPQITAFDGSPGFIGFWYKVLSGGPLNVGINLDRPANTGPTMVGSVLKPAALDGEWHKVEWSLGNLSDWGAVSGIGGAAANLHAGEPLTIDSVYFTNIPNNSNVTILFDYVAWNPDGSIVPEPATLGLLALGLPFVRRSRRRL